MLTMIKKKIGSRDLDTVTMIRWFSWGKIVGVGSWSGNSLLCICIVWNVSLKGWCSFLAVIIILLYSFFICLVWSEGGGFLVGRYYVERYCAHNEIKTLK